MSSLLEDLQRDVLDSTVSITDLLRKASIVARKLNLTDFQEWIDREVKGNYPNDEVPLYRRIKGQVKARNPYSGWIPIIFPSSDEQKKFSERDIGQAIGEIESNINNRSGTSFCEVPFPPEIQSHLMKAIDIPLPPTLLVGYAQMEGIVDAVRNTILEWIGKLEEKGIAGEGMSFSDEETQTAATIQYNIQYFSGDVTNSQIQQDTTKSSQELEITQKAKDSIADFLSELSKKTSELQLEKSELDRLEADKALVEAQLSAKNPKISMIKAGLTSIKVILESAIGGVAGHYLLMKLLESGLL